MTLNSYFRFFKEHFSYIVSSIIFILLCLGFFSSQNPNNHLKFFTIFLIISLILFHLKQFLNNQEAVFENNFDFGLLLILAINLPIQQLEILKEYLFPLNYLLVVFLTSYNKLFVGLISIPIILSIEIFPALLHGNILNSAKTIITHASFLFLFSIIIGTFIKYERIGKKKIEKDYEEIRREAFALRNPLAERNKPYIRNLSWEEKRKQLLGTKFDLDERLFRILESIKKSLNPFSCVLYLIDHYTSELLLREVFSESENIDYNKRIKQGEGIIGWIIKHRDAIMLSEFNRSLKNIPYYTKDEGIKSLLAIPLLKSGIVQGVLCIDSLDVQAFSEEHKKLLFIESNHILDTIEYAEIRNQLRGNIEELGALNEIGKILNSTLNLDEVLQKSLDVIRSIVNFDFAGISLYDDENKIYRIQSAVGDYSDRVLGKGFSLEDGLVGWVTSSYKRTFLVSDFKDREKKKPIFSEEIPINDIQSVLCIPLIIKNISLGSFVLLSKKRNFFTDHEVGIFDVLANQISISIENARIHRKVEKIAITDGLTGLYNHRYFKERLDDELRRAGRHPNKMSLLMLDLDNFKKINDQYGHPVGDKMLRHIGNILRSSVREIDLVARYGGEEFAVVLVNTDQESALKMAERLRKDIELQKFAFSGIGNFKATVSVGISTFPDDGKLKDELIDKADQALYYAKSSGRNRSCRYKEIILSAPSLKT